MIKKTGPDLLRQTLTRLWFFNIFVQKPYKLGLNFMFVFKLAYLINIFLTSARPFRKNTFVSQITHQIKKNTHRLIEIGTYRIVTIRLNYQHYKLNFYTNISSRKIMFPKNKETFNFKHIYIAIKKKLKIFDYKHIISKKNIYTNFTMSHKTTIKQLKNNEKLKIFNKKFKNILLLQNKKKVANRNFNINLKKKKTVSSINTRFIKSFSCFDNICVKYKNLRRTSLRALRKRKKIIHIENTNYFQIFRKNKVKEKFLKLFLNNLFFDNFGNFSTFNKLKFLYIFKIFSSFKFANLFENSKRKKKLRLYKNWYFVLKKRKYGLTNLFWNNAFSYLNIIDENQIVTKKSNFIEKNWIYKTKKALINNSKFLFIKNQIFNQFLEFKIFFFLSKIVTKPYYKIFLKQEFSIPNAIIKLNIFEKNILRFTKFLKVKNKFYYNFINILPTLETFVITQFLANQIAAELARTKKHWKVLKGIQLLILQAYTQMRKHPINITSSIKGLKIIIRGRPNKISRTKKVSFIFGTITKASFVTANVTKSFAKSNAQIGSFGVHVLAVT